MDRNDKAIIKPMLHGFLLFSPKHATMEATPYTKAAAHDSLIFSLWPEATSKFLEKIRPMTLPTVKYIPMHAHRNKVVLYLYGIFICSSFLPNGFADDLGAERIRLIRVLAHCQTPNW